MRSEGMIKLILGGCLLFIMNVALHAKSETIPLQIEQTEHFYIENRCIEFYQDTTNSLNYHDVCSEQFDSLFQHPTFLSITGIKTNIWFRFEVENQSEHIVQWIIAVPDFTYIDVFIADQFGNVEVLKAGKNLPASKKQMKSGMWETTYFSLQGNEKKTIYVKAFPEEAIKIQKLFKLYEIHSYYDETSFYNLLQGVFNGFLIMMLLYSLFLFFMTRQKSYLYYIFYILCILISTLALLQYVRYLLFPENPEINFYFGFTIFFAFIFYFLFIREFLDSRKNNLKLDRLLKIQIKVNLIFAIVIIAVSFFSLFIYALFSILFILGNLVVVMVAVLKVLRKSSRVTQIFALGSLFLVIGIFFSAFWLLMGVLKEYILPTYQLTIVSEVLIFSVGLSYKYRLSEKMEREERNKLNVQLQKNEHLQKKVNLELEDKVKERTMVISKQKDEIDTLYKEVNHRVKNNFAIILGILENQIDNTKVPEIKDALINASSRINSMSLIHDLIHRNYSSTAISAKEYINQLAYYIIDLKADQSDVRAAISCPNDLFIDMQMSVSLGTIVNELILNSIKHAKTETGHIECKIEINKIDRFLHLKYNDNGNQTIPDNVIKKKSSIGMYLIETMTRQMDGQLSMKVENGFVAELSLKIQE